MAQTKQLEPLKRGVPLGRVRPRTSSPVEAQALQFPGCRPVSMTAEQLENYDGRLEYWSARTKTAWMVREPTAGYHEQPSQNLAALAAWIATLRGSPIKCFGTVDLLELDANGAKDTLMQADQTVYLHPGRENLPGPGAMTIGRENLPDVVLEVDYTTDVRSNKLPQYKAWGFAEIWIEVPDHRSSSRPLRRASGLTIHLLEDDGGYRVSAQSRAFAGWTADEIHLAMNETQASASTYAAIQRVAAALGAQEGTGPDDDPLLRLHRSRSRAEGHAEGRLEGRAQTVRQILRSRGIEVSAPSPGNAQMLASFPEQAVVDAALACDSEADFWARLR